MQSNYNYIENENENENENKKINKKKILCEIFNSLIKVYFLCFSCIVVYYLISMNNTLSDFNNLLNNKLLSINSIVSCLFKDICYTSDLGKQLCGNCYSNRSNFIQ